MSFMTTLLLHGALMFVLTLPLLGCGNHHVRNDKTQSPDKAYEPSSFYQAPKNAFFNPRNQWEQCKVGQGGSACGNPSDQYHRAP